MTISKTDVLGLVKTRLALQGDVTHDGLITMYIDEMENRILHYINAKSIPEGLKFTWAAMAASALSSEQYSILFPAVEEAFEVTLGDTTVKPVKPVSAPSLPSLVVMDAVMFDYKTDLNRYRKLRW